jgi:membrane protease YdiL (CAAX protease family)
MIISDHKTFFLLVLALAFLAAVSVFLPQGEFMAGYELPVTKPLLAAVNFFAVLAVYGGIGWLGTTFSSKLGFAKIWDRGVCNRKRFVYPLSAGIGLGIFFILIDFVASLMHDLGPLPHPPFPLSLLASATAAIGEEIIARLFFVSFFVWLILRFCRKSNINLVFWAVAILSAAVFTAMHIPSIFAVSELIKFPLKMRAQSLTSYRK